jgi:molybdopterin converting factor small subunit
MEVTIRCYGEVAEAVGEKTLVRVLESRSTVGDVVDGLEAEFDEFAPEDASGGLVYRVNGGHAEWDTRLSDGDAVALSQSPMRE